MNRRNSILSAGEVIVNALCLFFIYRNVVQVLGVSTLGVWALVLATTSFGRAADLGISGALTRFIARSFGDGSASRAIQYMRTGVAFMGIGMGAVALALWGPLWYCLSIALDGDQLSDARDVLPWAVLSLWLLFVKTAVDSCLLGIHRADVRSIAGAGGMLLQLALSLALAEPFGLKGLAWAQASYYALAISAELVVLLSIVSKLQATPATTWFSGVQLREMLGFGVKLQVGSVFNLFFDPLVKTLLGAVGGTAFLGVVEIAYRMAYTARNVVVQALQPSLAVFAELSTRQDDALLAQFHRVSKMAAWATASVMSLVALGAPIISWLYLGNVDFQLVYATAVLSLTWAATALVAPSYYLGLATGRVVPYVIAEGLAAAVGGVSVYVLGNLVAGDAALFGVLAGKVAGAVALAVSIRRSAGWGRSPSVDSATLRAAALTTVVCGLVAGVGLQRG